MMLQALFFWFLGGLPVALLITGVEVLCWLIGLRPLRRKLAEYEAAKFAFAAGVKEKLERAMLEPAYMAELLAMHDTTRNDQ
jgi:hypothetical protein